MKFKKTDQSLTGHGKLSENEIIAIYISEKKTIDISKKYGVYPSTVTRIKSKQRFHRITDKFDDKINKLLRL